MGILVIFGIGLLIVFVTVILILQTKWYKYLWFNRSNTCSCNHCSYRGIKNDYLFCPKCGRSIILKTGIEETHQILSTPANSQRISDTLNQYEKGKKFRINWEEHAKQLASEEEEEEDRYDMNEGHD